MNTQEYIIVNKTTIQKKIKELEIQCKNPNIEWHDRKAKSLEIISLQEVLSQSTPLIPEIEKAFEQGQNSVQAVMKCEEFGDMDWYAAKKIIKTKQEYISNLQLEI